MPFVLYRGAKPQNIGYTSLVEMGVKTVVDLQIFSVFGRFYAKRAKLGYKHISGKPWHPEDEDVAAFLAIVTNPAKQPVFAHCREGADRTGMMCAIYRIVVQGWNKTDAVEEMVNGGFGFHRNVWTQIVPYILALDVKRFGKYSESQLCPTKS